MTTLAQRLGTVSGADTSEIPEIEAAATDIVSDLLTACYTTPPQPVIEQATLAAGMALWEAKKHPNGIIEFAGDDGVTLARTPRDPRARARAILATWLQGGFA